MRNINKNMQRPIFKKKNKPSSSSTIKSLPKELLVEIVASVASHSIIDLHNVKKSCKDLLEAVEDNYVYRRVSLDKFSFIPRFSNDKELLFLKRCKENQNTESLYREGLRECLWNGNAEGLRLLDMAAKEGHKEAKYVYGIILLYSSRQDEKLIELGLRHLRFLRESKCIVRTRKKVEEFVRIIMWKNNGMIISWVNRKLPLCPFKNTCRGWRVKKERWTLHDDDDDDIFIDSCEYCRWDYELKFLAFMD
ncbi:putative F-box protein At1g67623 [Arachis stenosperma]|uniref:putative F-box protein At1g67623 n=1 Tax=Arachis stenosperma TaxID=217475 RepID=UPI0025AC0E64|nr:putative F-box protein At1g67623 [Arachis stenosperma]